MATSTPPTAHNPPARPLPARRDPALAGRTSATTQGEAQSPQIDASSEEPRITRIARRDHELYLARGGEHGRDIADWLQAERERSEEHTSELQSLRHLVCRLL